MLVVRWIPLISFIAPIGLWLMSLTAMGRNLDGRYANSPLKPWFDQLKSRNGLCCSYADGYVAEDADWEAKNDHYRVRVPRGPDSKVMVWIGVPDDSVITEPNKAGRTMVWPTYVASEPDDGGDTDDEGYPYMCSSGSGRSQARRWEGAEPTPGRRQPKFDFKTSDMTVWELQRWCSVTIALSANGGMAC